MSEEEKPKVSKLLWLLVMTIAMIIYILFVTRLIDALFSGNIIMELICYVIAGIIWIYPAKWVMFKINRTDTE